MKIKDRSAMLKLLAVLSSVLVAIGWTLCQSSQPVAEEAAAAQEDAYLEGIAALERYKLVPECSGHDAQMIENDITKMENLVSALHQLSDIFRELHADPSLVDDVRQAISKHTSLTIKYADQAIKGRCVNQADQVCRRLLEFYTGTAYAAIRDRAMVCIDDVRAAR
jgi:hypothetical protein